MKKSKKSNRIIWSNRDLNLKDWEDYFSEIGVVDEDKKYEIMYSLNGDYLEDERANFKSISAGRILVIADIGRWNGRRQGYKIVNDIKNILYSDCDYVEWYADQHNIRATMSHHDGTNYLLYREIRDGVDIDGLTNKIYNGEAITAGQLNYYTKSLRPYVANLYGW